MSESTIEIIIFTIVLAIITILYIITSNRNIKLIRENDGLTDQVLSQSLELVGLRAVIKMDGTIIHEMLTYIDDVETKLVAANAENAELRKRTLAYNAETDVAEPELPTFDELIDDALAIAAQATGGDFIRETEPEPEPAEQQDTVPLASVVPFKKSGY